MKLSILICTIPERAAMLGRLKTELYSQILPYAEHIQVCIDGFGGTIGFKRNRLLDLAIGQYVCFIDDDDWISENYIELLMKAINSDCDCASLVGQITFDGKDSALFEHSIKYNEYKTKVGQDITYERYPNHLNMIRTSIAEKFKFPEINHGEDTDFATQIYKSGLLKKEYCIPEIIYYYRYVSNKPKRDV